MSSAIILTIIEDWIKPSFLINIVISKEKTNSLNMSMLMNIDCWLITVMNYQLTKNLYKRL